MSLKEYRRKRDFSITAEPAPSKKSAAKKSGQRQFVIQKHDATRLHYDLRFELGGTLVSWAVPKGLPLNKGEKHLAVKVEDHPLAYRHFEGTIPKGQYGGGTVQVWDTGTYEALTPHPVKEIEGGKLHFVLKGKKLKGEWYLVRLKGEDDQWLVIRADADHPPIAKLKESKSALSGKTLQQLSESGEVWESKRAKASDEDKPKVLAKVTRTKVKPAHREKFDPKNFLEPMKALSVTEPPHGEWVWEIKFDGFRIVAYKDGKSVHLMSRTQHDLTDKFPEIEEAVRGLKAKRAIIDGEIVALDPKGRSSFQLLQAYELGQEKPPLCFYTFDVLALEGKSLRNLPLEERKEKLESLLPAKDNIMRFSASLPGTVEQLMEKVRSLGLEGLIGKKPASTYEVGRRTGAWIKLKHGQQQEFVIGGYSEPSGSRHHFGALLVGVYTKGKLIYSGKVGTGFNHASLKDLFQQMNKLSRKECPFTNLPEEREGRYGAGITASVMKRCHWIQPKLVAQIKFAEWTRDGRLRQPVFLGLREDKDAKDVVREITV